MRRLGTIQVKRIIDIFLCWWLYSVDEFNGGVAAHPDRRRRRIRIVVVVVTISIVRVVRERAIRAVAIKSIVDRSVPLRAYQYTPRRA